MADGGLIDTFVESPTTELIRSFHPL